MCDFTKRLPRAHYAETESCTLYPSSTWQSDVHEVAVQADMHGETAESCMNRCLENKNCDSFRIGVDSQPDKCRLLAMGKNRHSSNATLVQPLPASSSSVGICDRKIDKRGSVRAASFSFKKSKECELISPMRLKDTSYLQKTQIVLEQNQNHDEYSCAHACINTPECSAFDVFIDKKPDAKHGNKDPRVGLCRLFSMQLPSDDLGQKNVAAEPSQLLQLVSPVKRDQVVGICRATTKCSSP